ncbi:MAG: pyruvate formate lyase family protein, partial [Chloroflexi bacterium]|nr:pyruvate formate lyase family protein [Chloroflexota bacterium]
MVIATAEIDQISRVNALTDRVRKRKEEWFDARPHVDAERARLVTESWKETEDEPAVIRRAKLFKKIMEGISVTIREGELIVGYQSRYIRGASPAIDFNSTYGPQLFASEHLTLSGEVKTGEISEAEKASILEDSAYWKGRAPGDVIARLTKEVFGSKIDDLLSARIAVSPCPHYAMPDYGKVIDVGLNGIIAEAKEHIQKLLSSDLSDESSIDRYHFLEAVVISCQGAINFARRYARLARKMATQEANETRKKELEMIAETCERVPADPARGFHEALQSAWFIALAGNLECGYMGSIPGRMDQYLYPSYQKDMDEGRLTRQEAAELVGCYWVKLCEMEHIRPTERKQIGQGNQILDVTLGGLTREGRDATNELTYLILEVAHQFKTPQPSVFLRVHNETPQALWMKAVEVNRDRGDGQPAFMNDEAVLLNQTGLGVSLEDARDYQATGCLHPLPSHAAGFNQIKFFNMAKVLEL